MNDFVPGQRWLSEAQSELGLGTVTASDERTVQLFFPAADETRLYARRDAPLARATLAVGELLRNAEGKEFSVVDLHNNKGLITYLCEDVDGNQHVVPETEVDPHTRLNRPNQRLLSGRVDKDVWFSLRHQTWLMGMREASSRTFGLAGARIGLIPHQLYIGAEVADRVAPRVLLADEVGLGKTIEAGLILHRMLLTGRAQRVLLVVPDALQHQWLVEMLRRFNLLFSLFDAERFAASDGDNPFESEQRVLLSLEFLVSSGEIARAALGASWDLMIVDEAHHLAWSEQESSLEYDLIEALSQEVPGVLLLTATPEQLGRAGHFGRLRLLDPDRFHDYQAFVQEEERYEPVARLAAAVLDEERLGDDEQALLDALIGPQEHFEPDAVINQLVDRHGTGRILFRNTRSAIPGFPERIPSLHRLECPGAYENLGADAVTALRPERAFSEAGGADWVSFDPRVPWLVNCLRELRPEKVLVIAASAATVLELRALLKEREGIPAAVFHEGMEIVERDRAAAFFADNEDGAQVLICSEIGSEGRNFQFAHHLVLFDLPLEPELLEQRIGRLDRIGQTRDVQIHVPVIEGLPGAALARFYHEGLNAFAAPCPAAAVVVETLSTRLLAAMADGSDLDALVADARALTGKTNAELEQGRDRLLELNSHRHEVSDELVDAITAQDSERSVEDYMIRTWDAFGVDHEPGPGASLVLSPGRHMLHDSFPELPDDGATVTFRRTDALAHEDRELLTWEHPMVRGAMEMLTSSDLGTSSAAILMKDPRFKPGTLLLEMLYIAECPAPPELMVRRFLPPTLLRFVIDNEGKNRAAELSHADLTGACMTRNRKLARAVIDSQAKVLEKMIAIGDALSGRATKALGDKATERMRDKLGAEVERLKALAEINPSVRADEIEALEYQRERIGLALAKVHLRPDAIRLVVCG